MAIQFFDGFDDYGTSNSASFNSIYVVYTGSPNGSTPGAFGGAAVGYAYYSSVCAWMAPLLTPAATIVVGARFSIYGSQGGLAFCDSTGKNIAFVDFYLGAGSLAVSAWLNGTFNSGPPSNGSSLGAKQNIAYVSGAWVYLEAEITVGTGTSGSLIVKANGATVLNYTGINTQGTAGSLVSFAGPYIGAANVDDLYILDTTGAAPYNTFLTAVAGPMGPRVYTAVPIADDGVTWTPNSGTNNYSRTSETAFDGDTTYVSTATAGNIDLYDIAPLTGGSVILAAQTTFVAREDDTGTREVAGVINSGGADYVGATRTMTANYQKFVDLYLTDPATGAAWAASKFTGTPAVFGGYKCIA